MELKNNPKESQKIGKKTQRIDETNIKIGAKW